MNQNNQAQGGQGQQQGAGQHKPGQQEQDPGKHDGQQGGHAPGQQNQDPNAVAEASKAVRPDDSRLFAPGEIRGLFNEAWLVWLAARQLGEVGGVLCRKARRRRPAPCPAVSTRLGTQPVS
jgi:hypothetical protein